MACGRKCACVCACLCAYVCACHGSRADGGRGPGIGSPDWSLSHSLDLLGELTLWSFTGLGSPWVGASVTRSRRRYLSRYEACPSVSRPAHSSPYWSQASRVMLRVSARAILASATSQAVGIVTKWPIS